ncbi:hypothetical protein PQ455_10485 [Sphingomonas naphthae]|uniref:Mor transcription activator domain-containing protein n=1 Tax=Sphingomonas naphthae TaxID=1813468 RepID=A0ABY7TGK8_9SPHN|nr:hypothetical protein [Sphingomonas naphthae]WCT72075.1 hypothetical protein PQ455_10485 [Sphingomonas naphthae]
MAHDAQISPSYQLLVDAVGETAANAIVRKFGGRYLYIPKRLSPHDPLVKTVGLDDAMRLVEAMPATRLHIPKRGREREVVRELAATGRLTRTSIAEQTGYSERQVYRILGEDDPESGQIDLFE